MKTAEDFIQNLIDTVHFIAGRGDKLRCGLEKTEKFEAEIRADQDKITRHACAEKALECGRDVSGQCVWVDDVQVAIINTVAI